MSVRTRTAHQFPRVTLSGAKRNRTPEGRGIASGSTRGLIQKTLLDPFVTSFLGFARILSQNFDARFALAQGDTKA